MKLKLDENFGHRCVDVLSEAGHDVATVAGQQMSGAADEDVIQACHSESRCLVSLDLDSETLCVSVRLNIQAS
jgi:predicted nuclease of predicted toxin-antitoxin system